MSWSLAPSSGKDRLGPLLLAFLPLLLGSGAKNVSAETYSRCSLAVAAAHAEYLTASLPGEEKVRWDQVEQAIAPPWRLDFIGFARRKKEFGAVSNDQYYQRLYQAAQQRQKALPVGCRADWPCLAYGICDALNRDLEDPELAPCREAVRSRRCIFELLGLAYQLAEEESLDETGRWTREAVFLRYAALGDLATQEPLESLEFLEKRYANLTSLVEARAQLRTDPEATQLRTFYGALGATTRQHLSFFEDVVESTLLIAAKYPDLGGQLGHWVEPMLKRASEMSDDAAFSERVEAVSSGLLETDSGRLAGPAYFYLAVDLSGLLTRGGSAQSRIEQTRRDYDRVQAHLDKGLSLTRDPERAWIPFLQVSDHVFELYRATLGRPFPETDREWLISSSILALAQGLRAAAGEESSPVPARIQQTLFDRFRLLGDRLLEQVRFQEFICLAAKLLADPAPLSNGQQEELHAQLAKSYYALGHRRKALEHLAQSGGRIGPTELEAYGRAVSRFIQQTGLQECDENDW